MIRLLASFLAAAAGLVLVAHAAASPVTLEAILARPSPPPGVVFEIVDRDPDALELALPWVKDAAARAAELLDAASLRVSQADPACPPEIRRLDVRRHAALLVELQAPSAEELAELQKLLGRG